jgi:hypothetical protein
LGGIGIKTGECGWEQHIFDPHKYTWHPCDKPKKCMFRDKHKNFWGYTIFGPDENPSTAVVNNKGIRPKTNQQAQYRVLYKKQKKNLGKCF